MWRYKKHTGVNPLLGWCVWSFISAAILLHTLCYYTLLLWCYCLRFSALNAEWTRLRIKSISSNLRRSFDPRATITVDGKCRAGDDLPRRVIWPSLLHYSYWEREESRSDLSGRLAAGMNHYSLPMVQSERDWSPANWWKMTAEPGDTFLLMQLIRFACRTWS